MWIHNNVLSFVTLFVNIKWTSSDSEEVCLCIKIVKLSCDGESPMTMYQHCFAVYCSAVAIVKVFLEDYHHLAWIYKLPQPLERVPFDVLLYLNFHICFWKFTTGLCVFTRLSPTEIVAVNLLDLC